MSVSMCGFHSTHPQPTGAQLKRLGLIHQTWGLGAPVSVQPSAIAARTVNAYVVNAFTRYIAECILRPSQQGDGSAF